MSSHDSNAWRIAREALLDTLLGKNLEPWSPTRRSSLTEDAPQSMLTRTCSGASPKTLAGSSLSRRSGPGSCRLSSDLRFSACQATFDSLKLDIRPASAASQPHPRMSSRDSAIARACSWPSRRLSFTTLAQLFKTSSVDPHVKLGRPASLPPADDECTTSATRVPPASCVRDSSLASTFCKDVNAADTCCWPQSMPAKVQGSFLHLLVFMGEDDTKELHDSSFLL